MHDELAISNSQQNKQPCNRHTPTPQRNARRASKNLKCTLSKQQQFEQSWCQRPSASWSLPVDRKIYSNLTKSPQMKH